MSAERSFGAKQETELPSGRPVAKRYAVFQSEFRGGGTRDSSSDAESVAPD